MTFGEPMSSKVGNAVFVFNAWDVFGNQYTCLYKDGTHRVYLVEGEEMTELCTGTYAQCADFVDETLLVAKESIW